VEVEKRIDVTVVRKLLEEGKPFNVIMQEIMKIGHEIVEQHGHVDYQNIDEFLEALSTHSTPLNVIDREIDTNVEGAGRNVVCVKQCTMKDLMKEMSEAGGDDAKVTTVMQGHQLREGEESNFIDIGCYIMQQLRQMMISSIKVGGQYDLNYIHLGCDKGTGKRTVNKGDVEAIHMDQELLNKLLDKYDCVYAISYKEGQ